MSYNIGSLNIKKGDREGDLNNKFYDFIHKFIRDAELDILAIQEISQQTAFNSLLDSLKGKLPSWEGSHSDNSEFAFFWNPEKVEECSSLHTPQIYRSNARMKNDPYYGRFAPKNLKVNIEFRLVNIHLVHGGDNLQATIKKRKLECGLVIGEIYQNLDFHDGNFNRPFTLVLGDYNLDCDTCNHIDQDGVETVQTGQTGQTRQAVETVQTEKTTLKSKSDEFSRSYDHFSYDTVRNESVKCEVSRIDAVSAYFNGSFEDYRKTVSDHVPVVFKIH
jgi:endonuclease/exonuclease/phosphatase family metal-dependent hydrolase